MTKSILKTLAKHSATAQRFYRWYRRQQQKKHFPDWAELLSTNSDLWARARARTGGPKVLIATGMGGHPTGVMMDSLLAAALTLRGAEVHFLLCDEALPACQMTEYSVVRPRPLQQNGPQRAICASCFGLADRIFRPLGLKTHRYSSLATAADIEEARRVSSQLPLDSLLALEIEGVPIGEHASAGTIRYFASANLEHEPWAEPILRRYVQAAMITASAMRRVMRTERFDVVSCHHGIYVPQGLVAAIARAESARVVTWNAAYRKRCFVFSHSDTYHHTLMTEPPAIWESMHWTPKHEQEITQYLHSRRRGGRDWIVFQNRRPREDRAAIEAELPGLDLGKPTIAMLTNVAWDAQLHYPANAFSDMLDWVIKTVEYFASRPDLQLAIRVHPAEVSGDIPSRQPVEETLARRFPKLPTNVFVISAKSQIGTYALAEACDSAIIFGTKTGVELTSLGIPVVVAGEAWIRGKGLTRDAHSEADYFKLLDQLPFGRRMSPEQVDRAKRYAFHFFFRRMIPIEQMQPTGGEPQSRIQIAKLDELLPGGSRGLDIVCDGILCGSPFIYPAEESGVDE